MNRREWLVFSGALAAGLRIRGTANAQAKDGLVLPDATPVRMKIGRTISSATEKEGNNVDFETLDDVKIGEVIVIPKGSAAIGTITAAEPKRSMGRAGKLDVNIDFVRLPSGEKLALRGVQDVKGGGHTGAMTGAIVATSIVFFPAAPLFLFIKGKDIEIPKGHEITVYTNSEYKVTSAQTPTISTITAPRPVKLVGTALTNSDVVSLKEAGLTDQVIIDKIRSSPATFSIETSDIVALKKAGIADTVISAMLEASRR